MIYILTAGSYSDYHIEAATTDKAKAESLAAKLYCDIEEYNDFQVDVKDRNVYEVEMERDGNTIKVRRSKCYTHGGDDYTIESGVIINWCWAKDEKHAVKITNELRSRLIAEGDL